MKKLVIAIIVILILIGAYFVAVRFNIFNTSPSATGGQLVLKDLPPEEQEETKKQLREIYSTPFIPANLLLTLEEVEEVTQTKYEEQISQTPKGEGEQDAIVEQYQRDFVNIGLMNYMVGETDEKPEEVKPLFVTSFLIAYTDEQTARGELLKNKSAETYTIEQEKEIEMGEELEAYQLNILNDNGTHVTQIEYLKDSVIVRLMIIGEKYFETEAPQFSTILAEKWQTLEFF